MTRSKEKRQFRPSSPKQAMYQSEGTRTLHGHDPASPTNKGRKESGCGAPAMKNTGKAGGGLTRWGGGLPKGGGAGQTISKSSKIEEGVEAERGTQPSEKDWGDSPNAPIGGMGWAAQRVRERKCFAPLAGDRCLGL